MAFPTQMHFHPDVPEDFERATLILDREDAYEADGYLQIANGAWRLVYDDEVPASCGYADVVLGTYAASCEIFLVETNGSGTQIDIKL